MDDFVTEFNEKTAATDGDDPTCEQQMALDIVRRAKSLAGVEVARDED